MKAEVRRLGEEVGIVLPDRLISSLGWEPGDIVEVEVEAGVLKIARVETADTRTAAQLMDEYRDALAALAKS